MNLEDYIAFLGLSWLIVSYSLNSIIDLRYKKRRVGNTLVTVILSAVGILFSVLIIVLSTIGYFK